MTQKVTQKPGALEICVESSVANKCSTTPVGAGWEDKQSDKGTARTRTDWSPDGQALVTRSEIKLKDGSPAQVKLTRSLADGGKTTVQLLELTTKDGTTYKARRVLRRIAP